MAVNRTSTSLTRFFGAQLSAEQSRGAFGNQFRNGAGTERTVPAEISRLTQSDLFPASVNIEQYHVALAFLQKIGAAPNTIPAMATSLLDIARRQGTSVATVIDQQLNTLSLNNRSLYQYLNQLRDPSSQIGFVSTPPNSRSLISRRLR